jgi:hypothetical protein
VHDAARRALELAAAGRGHDALDAIDAMNVASATVVELLDTLAERLHALELETVTAAG